MIETVIGLLEHYVIPLGGFGVFTAEIIEEIIVPIPSAMILLGSGFLFLKGALSWSLVGTLLFTVAIPAAFGLTLGSLVIYALAYKGGKVFIDRYGTWVGISWKDIENLERKFEEGSYDEWSMILARVFPIIPSVLIATFCGLTRMPVRKYATLTFIGAFFKAVLLGLIGWQVGELYIKYAGIISHIENTTLVLVVGGTVLFLGYRKRKQKMLQ